MPLWIALHLPQLSLEAFVAACDDGGDARPVALFAGSTVACTNAEARRRGLHTGLKRATALALAPDLRVGEADAARDRAALAAVVDVALGFTPTVTVQPWTALDGPPPATAGEPPTVLLEVASTLALWGGRDGPDAHRRARLLQRLQVALAPLGHTLQVALAPTPAGAAVLAPGAPPWPGRLDGAVPDGPGAGPVVAPPPGRAATRNPDPVPPAVQAPDARMLEHALDLAPVWRVGPGRAHWEALQGMGLRTLGDLRRLPRAGVARRFGEPLLDTLDRAFGTRPDPRPLATLPERFDRGVELFHRADTADALLPGAERLFTWLAAWLRARKARARRCTFTMLHEGGRWAATPDAVAGAATGRTELPLALAEPSDDADHLLGLLREHLARLPLPAPTLDLRLRCDDLAVLPPPDGELFPSAAGRREGFVRLIERLQARLGPAGIRRPVVRDDHRPEVANALEPLATAGGPATRPGTGAHTAARPAQAGAAPARPVWLVEPPQPLADGSTGPRLGPVTLRLLSGPERLEAGWWDADAPGGAAIERDYFVAQAPDGALLWLFRLRRPAADGSPGWFLHGRFG